MVTPSKPLAAPQPLNIAFPLGNGGVLRSQTGEGLRKEGDGGEGKKRRKKGRAKSAQILEASRRGEGMYQFRWTPMKLSSLFRLFFELG